MEFIEISVGYKKDLQGVRLYFGRPRMNYGPFHGLEVALILNWVDRWHIDPDTLAHDKDDKPKKPGAESMVRRQSVKRSCSSTTSMSAVVCASL